MAARLRPSQEEINNSIRPNMYSCGYQNAELVIKMLNVSSVAYLGRGHGSMSSPLPESGRRLIF